MTDDRLLDVQQAAKRWQVCADTIRQWVRLGKLRAIRTPGNRIRIPESALPSVQKPSSLVGPRRE